MNLAFLLCLLLSSIAHAQIRVAIIDTGVDQNHPELKNHLWKNKGEMGLDADGKDKSSNEIDDDGNGFIDDVHGWNFAAQNSDLTDRHGHGSHIAGIIGQVAPEAELMILKYYDPQMSEKGHVEATVKAIHYAIEMKANIINFSGGGPGKNAMEEAAIRIAKNQGILFVAAAGNEAANSDKFGFFPADYGLSNIISVTAHDQKLKLLPTSNFGIQTVDIIAPGNEILSTLPGSRHGLMTGTSQATAFVSGAAARLMQKNPDFRTPNVVKKYLLRSGDRDLALLGKTKYQVRLNWQNALMMKDLDASAFGTVISNAAELDPTAFSSNLLDDY